ncbi:DUF4297 family anti-phage-associated protein [Flavobacterium yafengii]|uniref:DUF4297 family anti-phage-associated protein n=1 Tax=Flavobacterium yafengii TaxID=3041253 RepID=UPI0024A8A3B4|nr:DUF4297 family anti-phage-associated protein [Flavobacterium yafengii]MDI5897632.1 hypothetical protein [Flavobacterium yafengii]
MADRTAIDTIRGYFYQFDYTIFSLLNLPNMIDSIVVEGVEDIDIKTATEITAIQCKYYEKTEYNHSVIAEPIRLMLNHFKEVKNGNEAELNYKLRGYYKSGQSKLSLPLSVQSLKDDFLTYSRTEKIANVNTKVKHYHHIELNLDDSDLFKFLNILEVDINAKEFEEQYKGIIQLLKIEFKCSDFFAENYFYNSALKAIRDLSKESNIVDRNISKQDFLQIINNSKILFNEWFLKIKGEKLHYANIRKEFFGDLNILHKERYFLFDVSVGTNTRAEIKDILNLVIKKYTKIINQPNPFCSYIYLHGINDNELIEIKKDMIEDGIIFRDGFDFEGATFNPVSLLTKPNVFHQIKLKFINNIDYLEETLKLTGRKSEIYLFYKNDSFFKLNNSSIKQIAIQINELSNIKNII